MTAGRYYEKIEIYPTKKREIARIVIYQVLVIVGKLRVARRYWSFKLKSGQGHEFIVNSNARCKIRQA